MTAKAHDNCDPAMAERALGRAFLFLGKRWNGMILASLGQHGPAGFAVLKRQVGGITDSMLSDRLTELADAGLVIRSVSHTRPPTVSYELAPAGLRLIPVFGELATWAVENLPERDPVQRGL
jgi:DNA-binding HxlR family transcriptional regulator